jgi:hypothetical protein
MERWPEGQLEGRKITVSIHLRRRLKEAEDRALKEFYDRLLQCLGRLYSPVHELDMFPSRAPLAKR